MTKQPSLLSPADDLTQILGPDLAAHFLAHRKALRKPMTAFAAQLMAKKLRGFTDPIGAVENAILKGWTDVYEVDKPYALSTGVAAQREKLRQDLANEQGSTGQTAQDFGRDGGLFITHREGPNRPH